MNVLDPNTGMRRLNGKICREPAAMLRRWFLALRVWSLASNRRTMVVVTLGESQRNHVVTNVNAVACHRRPKLTPVPDMTMGISMESFAVRSLLDSNRNL